MPGIEPGSSGPQPLILTIRPHQPSTAKSVNLTNLLSISLEKTFLSLKSVIFTNGGNMIDLKAQLIPMRMVLMHKEPVELEIELINNSNKNQMVSIDIYSGDRIGFDKGGRNTFVSKKIID